MEDLVSHDSAARGGPGPLPIITHRLPLERYAEAFALVAAGHAGKVVLLPQVTG